MSESKMIQVTPVIDSRVRGLCVRAYEGHKKGCPNYNDPKHAYRCPPQAPLFQSYFSMDYPIYAVINEFDLGAHVERMLAKPKANGKLRTLEEARCVLYWQGTARKQLKSAIGNALRQLNPPGLDPRHCYEATWCPEGMGVDVTRTLAAVGIPLEWPPKRWACQVAFLAKPAAERAYNEGWSAAYWNEASKNNPYGREDPNNAEWYRGWFDATEARKAPPLKYG